MDWRNVEKPEMTIVEELEWAIAAAAEYNKRHVRHGDLFMCIKSFDGGSVCRDSKEIFNKYKESYEEKIRLIILRFLSGEVEPTNQIKILVDNLRKEYGYSQYTGYLRVISDFCKAYAK